MNNNIAHIIGLDEIHKKKLIKNLPKHIKIIDLDEFQQKIHNHPETLKQKSIWNNIANEIVILRKRKRLIGSKKIKNTSLDREIKKLSDKKNKIRKNILNIWKTKMKNYISEDLKNKNKSPILFLGFNIFPKDYRAKINLPLNHFNLINDNKKYFNKVMIDSKPTIYAANQIKYFLASYSDKIIRGTFPLNLLKVDYLSDRYQKFINFYDKQGYHFVPLENILDFVKELDKQVGAKNKLANKFIYIATIYRSGDIIPINTKTPIQGYLTKEEAIDSIKNKIKGNKIQRNTPIYLYRIKAEQFHIINDQIIANQALYPIDEESLILTN